MHSASGGSRGGGEGGVGGLATISDAAESGGSQGGGEGGVGGAATGFDAVLATGGAGGTVAADAGVDSRSCDGSAMAGTWYRALDGLVMILAAKGCVITGSSDNPSFRHTIEGTYDDVARTMIGTIHRTTVANGCVTVMQTTWVLTDPQHFTVAIVGTDGLCDLATTYHEVTTFVRQ
jgi:hypothetical protein